MANQRMGRTFALRIAADKLRLNDNTAGAMTHFETATDALMGRGLTWDDVPEKCGALSELLPGGIAGKLALRIARRTGGFRAVEEAFTDPAHKLRLLGAYAQCLEVAPREEAASLSDVVRH